VTFTVPVRDRRTLSRCDARWTTLSRRPGSRPILHRSLRHSPTLGIPSYDALAGTFVPMTAPTRPPFTPTATLLGALRRSLFEARYRLPTSATAHDVRALSPSSRFLAGTKASTFFLFLRVTHDLSCFAVSRDVEER